MPHADRSRDVLRQRYADLLPAEREDPALARVVHDLDALMTAPPPAGLQRQIGRQVLAQATARYQQQEERPVLTVSGSRQEAHQLAPHAKSHTWLAWTPLWARRPAIAVAIALLAVLALSGGAAYAVTALDPGLRFQLGVPVASGPTYTSLHVSHKVGDTTVTLARAAFTSKQVIVGYTYDRPAQGPTDTGHDHVCSLSLTSSEGDTFQATAGDILPEGTKNGVVHGSTVLYFTVDHLRGDQQQRHLRLVLSPCDGAPAGDAVPFDFTVPLQR